MNFKEHLKNTRKNQQQSNQYLVQLEWNQRINPKFNQNSNPNRIPTPSSSNPSEGTALSAGTEIVGRVYLGELFRLSGLSDVEIGALLNPYNKKVI